ncbi:MAG: hypothetical protein H0Z18_04775 [Thermococcus sp.]|uniref:hypothetical protein n=1 Tax=Thermococcus sp. TaxID=35749 RepID=UPI001D24EEF8|nr:hypothetical protein [Thermococcus sp.]MBO8174552.1 hypothetical protein [Thermococcus sp.]
MDKVEVYGISCGKEGIIKMFERIIQYGLVDIDVENRASFLDDMLKSTEDKLRYAIQKLEENDVDTARFVIKDGTGVLIVKIEDVITIRATIKEYKKFIEDFRLVTD